jgi:hypothetical protein
MDAVKFAGWGFGNFNPKATSISAVEHPAIMTGAARISRLFRGSGGHFVE